MPLTETAQGLIDIASDAITHPEIDAKEILAAAGFTEDSINSLGEELLTRFEASYNIYSRGVEGNLALRNVLSQQQVEGVENGILNSDISGEQLSGILEAFIENHPTENESPASLETIARDAAGAVVENVGASTETLLAQAEETAKSGFSAALNGTVIGKILSYFKLDDKLWDSLKSNSGGILVSFLGWMLGDSVMSHVTGLSSTLDGIRNGNTTSTDGVSVAPIIPQEETPQEPQVPETVELNTGKRGAAISGGYILLSYMSGKRREEHSESIGVYERLSSLSYNQIFEKYNTIEYESGLAKPGELQRVFGDIGNIQEDKFLDIIEGIVGPYNTSFLNSVLAPQEQMTSLIFTNNDTEYSRAALEIFTTEELDKIKTTPYQDLKLDEISRLVVLYCKRFYSTSASYLQEAVGEVSQGVRNFIFGEELQAKMSEIGSLTEESTIYPERISLLFRNILVGKQYINTNAHGLINRPGVEDLNLTQAEVDQVEAIVAFRDQLMNKIPENYSLGIPGFRERFNNAVEYKDIISLFLLLGGRNIDSVSNMDDIIIYTWVYNLFTGSEKGLYESAALGVISDESDDITQDQKNILTVVLFRFAESNRTGIINDAQRALTFGHEVVKNEILGDVPISDTAKDYLAYTLEAGGAYAIWRILSMFPTTRTVIFVTAGITIGAILIAAQETVYNQLDTEIQNQFKDFLETNVQAEGENVPGGEILQGIQDGSIGTTDLLSRLNATIDGSFSS